MSYEQSNPELDSFREQWKAEVRARKAAGQASSHQQNQQHSAAARPSTSSSAVHATQPRGKPPPPSQKPAAQNYDDDYVQPRAFDEPAGAEPATSAQAGDQSVASEQREPVSALEHYEKAVETEAAGKLGDSLVLYRKAFRVSGSHRASSRQHSGSAQHAIDADSGPDGR